jgi:gp16 family phage-associated protein
MAQKPLTPEQVKQRLKSRGMTISGWARENGHKPRHVMLVLNGIHKGAYGEAHDIAVKLGLKVPEADEPARSAA